MSNQIHEGFKHGARFCIGHFNVIHENVEVGDDTIIKSYVEIRPNTKIGDNCYIDSGVKFSGDCKIGNRVTIRYDAIIARGVVIKDDVFISPQVMFVNIMFDDKTRPNTIIGKRVRIGTGAIIMAGVEIGDGVEIGAGAVVTKDCLEKGVYRASSELVAKRR